MSYQEIVEAVTNRAGPRQAKKNQAKHATHTDSSPLMPLVIIFLKNIQRNAKENTYA